MLWNRTRCTGCAASLGLSWLFAGALYIGILVLFFVAALIAFAWLGYWLAVVALMVLFLIVGGAAARYGPLELKTRWWAP